MNNLTHYFDVRLKVSRDVGMAYCLIHKALLNLKTTDVGVSFIDAPDAYVLRVHATVERLNELMSNSNMQTLNETYPMSWPKPTPETTEFAIFSRRRIHKDMSRLRRRMKRNNFTEEQMLKYKMQMCQESLNAVDTFYVSMESASTKQYYRRYIQITMSSELVDGEFDSFGLSKTATVPVF